MPAEKLLNAFKQDVFESLKTSNLKEYKVPPAANYKYIIVKTSDEIDIVTGGDFAMAIEMMGEDSQLHLITWMASTVR